MGYLQVFGGLLIIVGLWLENRYGHSWFNGNYHPEDVQGRNLGRIMAGCGAVIVLGLFLLRVINAL
jgi:hypothetical protein